jgi:hypothetical protein
MNIFRKSVEKIKVLLNSEKVDGYFSRRPMYIYDHISLNSSYNEKCFNQKLYRISKHTFCGEYFIYIYIYIKPCLLRDNLNKFCRAGEATDHNMEHTLCVLDTWGYKHTLGICNTYCFSTATVVARNITLYVSCLSLLIVKISHNLLSTILIRNVVYALAVPVIKTGAIGISIVSCNFLTCCFIGT